MTIPIRRLSLCVALCCLVPLSPALAITTPYSDNFNSSTVGTGAANFTTTGGTWAIVGSGAANAYQGTISAPGTFLSTVQVTDLGSSLKDFSISSTFVITDPSATASNATIGLGFLSNTSNLGTNYYLADISQTGVVRLLYFEGGAAQASGYNGFTSNTGVNLGSSLVTGTAYTMTLTGTYTGSTLNMSFNISDGTSTASITGVDTSPLSTASNNYFGYRLRQNASAPDAFTVEFDNFSIVPEPSVYALLLGGGFVLIFMQRLRRQSRNLLTHS